MVLNINEEVIQRLKKAGFYPNEMFSLLFALKAFGEKQIDLLDKYDDFNSSKRAVITYQTLFRNGLIEREAADSKIYFKLTPKGEALLKELSIEEVLTEREEVKSSKSSPSRNWIQEWINLFPVKSHERLLRGDAKDCEPRMNVFMKEYKYDKDIIFAATKSYLMSESSKEFKFTKNSLYFINKKGEGSALAGWCKTIKDGIDSGGKIDDGSNTKVVMEAN